jgi:hypothetical protein
LTIAKHTNHNEPTLLKIKHEKVLTIKRISPNIIQYFHSYIDIANGFEYFYMKEWKTHCNVSIPALDWRGEIRRDNKTAVAVVNSYRLTY